MLGNVCIIPARGGSKRIPQKNIKDFLGKPIIAYSIEMAKETNLFEEVMVSTDDLEIADIAKTHGAKVPFMRSKETSNDYATTMDVIKEVLEMYKEKRKEFDAVCCIYPTAVLANSQDILTGYKLLEQADIVLPITEYSFPPMRSLRVNDMGYAEFRHPEYMNTRSQDLEKWYHDAGQWYWYNTNSVESPEDRIKRGVVQLSNLRVQDIDILDDWQQAEIKYQILNKL